MARLINVIHAALDAVHVPVASTMSAGVRTALLALLALLVVIFGCLIAFAFVIRRRPVPGIGRDDGRASTGRARGGELRDPMACPVCHREFEPRLRFCPHDATRLIPAPEMLSRLADPDENPHHVCPQCRRSFKDPLRFCPHDGTDLVELSAHTASGLAGQVHFHDSDTARDMAKICPACRGRYGYAASFCGKDGVELVVLN